MKINIKNLNKSYDNEYIFKDFNLELTDEKVNCIIGKSGCGKTTILNMIAGLLKYDSGEIEGLYQNDISYVFQEDRLIKWLTVKENLCIALKKYYNKNTLEKEVEDVLDIVGIREVENKYPESLSGGMRQRVNIARAFGKPSKVILLDEPFKSLDYKMKYTIIDEFINILKKKKRMVILVTHDLEEAIYFEGKIIVFGDRPVRIQEIFENNLKENKNKILEMI